LEERVEQRTAELQQTLRNLRKTQGQLIHDEKMTSLGLLLAGIAHEINNPINFIAGNITPLQGYMQDLLGLIELYQDARPQTEPVIQERQEQIDLNFIRQDLPNMLNSLQYFRFGAQSP
jgi:signal transduction histidine kinase